MPSRPKWGTTPRKSIEAERARLGADGVVAGCVALLRGKPADPELILALGGRPARWAAGYDEPPGPAYWLRVWAARGLLHVWSSDAESAIIDALDDEAWRVREMALRVVGRHRIASARPAVLRLKDDPNGRVRDAAKRAASRLDRG
jgi:HEAT repeat protein